MFGHSVFKYCGLVFRCRYTFKVLALLPALDFNVSRLDMGVFGRSIGMSTCRYLCSRIKSTRSSPVVFEEDK